MIVIMGLENIEQYTIKSLQCRLNKKKYTFAGLGMQGQN